MFKAVQQLSDLEAPLVEPLLDDPQTKRITGVMPTGMREIPRETERIETGLAAAFKVPDAQISQKVKVKAPEKLEIVSKAETEESVPVKRGRGRPPKAAKRYRLQSRLRRKKSRKRSSRKKLLLRQRLPGKTSIPAWTTP